MRIERRFATALLTGLLLLSALPARAQAEDPQAYGDDYQQGDYGRVRFADNGVSILRASSEDRDAAEEAGSVNAPLFPGDSLRTGSDQRVEVQLATGTLVRVDADADLTLQSLPDAGASYQDNAVLRLSSGTIRIVSESQSKDEFRIDTPSASVYLLGAGDFRIDVDGRGRTSVSSVRGVAEVVGEGGSVLVRGGMSSIVDPGSIPDEARSRSSFASDPFDHWCANRDAAYDVEARGYDDGGSVQEVPAEVQPYYEELSSSGEWVDLPTYGRSWYPNDVAPGWRPYTDGYWSYGPGGYFWVSNEPWGWAPYHYGRWNWVSSYGWCWTPGNVFAGAWVSWSWGSLYLGWAPLDFWGRPCFYGSLSYGFYDPHCWTFVSYQHIVARNCGRYAVPIARIGNRLNDHVVVTRPPRVAPRRLANAPDWRDRAVREARQDTQARMRPIDRDRTPQRSMRDVDSQLSRRRPESTPARDRAPQARERQNVPGRTDRQQAAPPRSDRRDDRQQATPPRSDRRPVERPRSNDASSMHRPYPRTILVDPKSEGRRNADDVRKREDAGASRPTTDRVREMYRNLSQPRETRDREKAPADRPQAPRPGERREPQRTERPKQQMTPPPQQRPSAAPRTDREHRQSTAPRPQQQARPSAPQRAPQQARPSAPQRQPQQARPSPPRPQPPKPSAPKPKQDHGDKKHRRS